MAISAVLLDIISPRKVIKLSSRTFPRMQIPIESAVTWLIKTEECGIEQSDDGIGDTYCIGSAIAALTSHRDPHPSLYIVIYVDETNGYRTLTAHEGGPSFSL